MYCIKCGKEINGESELCEDCQRANEKQETQNNFITPMAQNDGRQQQTRIKKKCCPKCKSRNLQVVIGSEFHSETTGGGYSAGKGCCGYMALGPLGLLCGACGSKVKTTTTSSSNSVWFCRDCGNKFREVEDIDAQITNLKKTNYISTFIMILLALIAFIVFLNIKDDVMYYDSSEICILLLYGIPALIWFISEALSFIKSISVMKCLELEKQDIEINGYTYE
ncbi:MAG: hypothetical protein IJW06_04840 [Clostridia bacterium]|nr:hypothetical protein [Clostridia bacterium]